jgi:membrane protein YdbS with pleckstrin-like domain
VTRHPARTALLLVLAVVASSMAFFFHDPNPQVAIAAIAAWAFLIVAIYKAR